MSAAGDTDSFGTQRDEEAFRRLAVCACVHAVWTRDGSDEAAVAQHCFGLAAAIDVLDLYVQECSAESAPPAVRRFERTPSPSEFAAYLLASLPCVFPRDPDDALWETCRAWTTADGQPDTAALLRAFPPETVVSAASTSERTKMRLDEYADWWQRNVGPDGRLLSPDEPALYLKDLQFVLASPSFTSPRLFDDWLGGCHDERRQAEGSGGELPDLRFVYCGPAGSSTLLHTDLWGTHSWSSNLCGIKRWLFVAPWEAHKLFDRFGGRSASSFADSPFLYPHLRSARVVEVMQGPHEVMFVPSGWYHTVSNETVALSVNANWANASNLPHLYAHARSECVASPQGPSLTPLFHTYLRWAAERALRSGSLADADALAVHMRRLTLARVAHVLECWPELAPSGATELARRCRAALACAKD